MAARRLDEQFQFNSNEPVQREMRDFSKAIEIRFQPLEAQSVELDDVIRELQEVGLERINELLLPVSERLIAMAELGFLVAQSETPVTLTQGEFALFTIVEGPERELFTPTPFVVIQRGGRAEIGPSDDEIPTAYGDYAVGHVQSYDRETGALFVFLASTYGRPGPWDDWTISAGPGVSEATKAYYEAAIPAAARAEAAAEQTAEDRQYVEDARRALEEAGLNPDQYVWRDGTRPFLATIAGIAPGIAANDATLVTAAWTRARFTEADNSVRNAFRDADLAITEAYQAADALLLPRTGGTIHSGGSDPLTIAAPGGAFARIKYEQLGWRLWSAGVRDDSGWGIADDSVSAWRLVIDTNGNIQIGGQVNAGDIVSQGNLWTPGRVESGQGAYVNGYYPGQGYGLIAQYRAEMRGGMQVNGGNLDCQYDVGCSSLYCGQISVGGCWMRNSGGWLYSDQSFQSHDLHARASMWANGNVSAGGEVSVNGAWLAKDGDGWLRSNESFRSWGTVSANGDIAGSGVYARSSWGVCYQGISSSWVGFAHGQQLDIYNQGGHRGYAMISGSDERFKEGIVESQVDALAALRAIECYAFDRHDPATREFQKHENCGFLAQQILKVLPEAVVKSYVPGEEEPRLGPDWYVIEAYAVRAIQQIERRLEALEGKR